MPPPEAAAPHRAAAAEAAAQAAEAAAPEHLLEWDAGARTIRCGANIALPIPAGLTVYGRQDGGDTLTITPPGSPPGAALIILDVGVTPLSIDVSDPDFDAKFKTYLQRVDPHHLHPIDDRRGDSFRRRS